MREDFSPKKHLKLLIYSDLNLIDVEGNFIFTYFKSEKKKSFFSKKKKMQHSNTTQTLRASPYCKQDLYTLFYITPNCSADIDFSKYHINDPTYPGIISVKNLIIPIRKIGHHILNYPQRYCR